MNALLQEMQIFAKDNNVPIIKPSAAEILCRTVAEQKSQRILEIGTAIGYSALLMAQNAADNVEIITLELSAGRIATARNFINKSPYKKNITIIAGDAEESLHKLSGKFDFVFIDAAKGQYIKYLQAVLPLLTDAGIIAADNVMFRGYVESSEKPPRRYKTIVKRLREYLQEINELNELETIIYHENDGLAISKKRI
ncbi:O-methyltransferase [Pectinatus brassicae]|uniref:tRNA 5-hydroxyuridine methyltransferase n=1 Tax=Pectinatus brassicae TaxID=862415 RepID=A0A840UP44_9FIRM|nr:O-methyltransferase [Pectinatus brassicae]MBB5335982.1 putative O-methyltransferase YrrM [Pectinatus brassicae]